MNILSEKPKLFVVAGEPSGDAIAATVVESLRAKHPEMEILGAGGNKLRVAGQNQCLDLSAHAIMGAAEVILKLPKFFNFFKLVFEEIRKVSPDVLLLVDYPGFNLRLAKAVRKNFPQIKIVYLIAPKAWAWRPGRAKLVEKYVDLLIPVFSFEANWYRRVCPSLKIEYVGHPMVDGLSQVDIPTDRDQQTLAIYPGSRKREIQYILPPLLKACEIIKQRSIIRKVMIAVPDEKAAEQAQKILAQNTHLLLEGSYAIVTGMSREVATQACVGIVKSGTITAECAFLGLPMVVVYKASLVEALLMWLFVKVKFFSLVNLIAEREVVRELAQFALTPQKVSQETLRLLNNLKVTNQMKIDLNEIRKTMGGPGAAQRVADLVEEFLKEPQLELI